MVRRVASRPARRRRAGAVGRCEDALCCVSDVPVSRREPDPAHPPRHDRADRSQRPGLARRRRRGRFTGSGASGMRSRADPWRADSDAAGRPTVSHGRRPRLPHRPGRQVSHIFTSMFLHGSWMHLIGNMWFLWIFGDNIEDSMGRVRYAVFYLLCGVAAALAQVVLNPASGVPMVGASGAISGVMGAYLILFPRVRVFCLIFLGFFITSIALPAWTMLLYWAAIQLVSVLIGLAAQEAGGVAFGAHVGGFLAGVILIKLFARHDDVMAQQRDRWEPRRLVGR